MDLTGHSVREFLPEPEQRRPQVETQGGSYPAPMGYRPLTEADLQLVNEIKAHGEALGELVSRVEKHNNAGSEAKRWASIARTQFQQGYMALARSVTRPSTFA